MEDNNQYLDAILSTIDKDVELYKVPEGYFNGLPQQILEKVQEVAFSNMNAYSVPAGYFNSFADNILQKVKTVVPTNEIEEELAGVAPLLNIISKRNVYSIAENYFEQLPSRLSQQQFAEKSTIKVVPLTVNRKTWRNFAAAAVIAGAVLSGGLYLRNNKNDRSQNPSAKQYASSVSQNNTVLQDNLSDLSEDDIISYLAVPNTDNSISDSTVVGGNMSENTEKAISSMTNEELENYLDKTPTNF